MGYVDPQILACRQIQKLIVSVEKVEDVFIQLAERGQKRAPHIGWQKLMPSIDSVKESESHIHRWLEERLKALQSDDRCGAISIEPFTTNQQQAAVAMTLFESVQADAERLCVSSLEFGIDGPWHCRCSCFDRMEKGVGKPRSKESFAVFMEMGYVIWGTVAKMVFRYLEKAPPELLRGKCERRVFVSQIHELVFLGVADRTGWKPAQPTRKIKRR